MSSRILLVDHEPDVLSVLRNTLAAPERELLVAGSAAEALAASMQASSLEVALIDKALTDRSGLDVAREIRHVHPDAEVILLTGLVSLDSAIEAIKVGAFDYVSKPIDDFDALASKVQHAVEKVRLRREQRRLLERFSDSEERYRGVFQNHPEAMLVVDADSGRIEDANAAAQRLYGCSREELCALREGDLRASPASPARDDGGPACERHVRRDRTVFDAETLVGRFSFQKRPMRIVTVRDLGARHRLDFERGQLGEQQRNAQKMEAVGRLAGGVAHDFNNALTVILGNCEILLEDLGDDGRASRVREIVAAGKRAARLTERLLAFSRNKPAKLQPVDLNQVVGEMEHLLRRTIGENIQLLVVRGRDLWLARADADQLGQVLLNLVVNARDAMPRGGKLVIETANAELDEVAALLQAELPPGRYVRISVSDTGCGMDRETQARLFEPFFTTKEPARGSGLGLATVHGLVHQAGGAVRVDSEVGIGTTFEVYLPASVDATAEPATMPEKTVRRGHGETILIAEDEEGVRRLVRQLLSARGYNVIDGGSGLEALSTALVHPGRIDLLLADVVMPGCSGKELAERLCEVRPGLKVLLMTGWAPEATREYALVDDASSLLHKPFSEQALLEAVAAALEGAKPAGSS